jgi:hypothetical protein
MAAACYAAARIRACGLEMRQLVAQAISDPASWTGDSATRDRHPDRRCDHAVSVTPHATDPRSLEFQRRFAAAVPVVVVGKRIDEVKLDRIAGSSGPPPGFNAALERIEEQARTGRTNPEVTLALDQEVAREPRPRTALAEPRPGR